jgi:cyclase
VLGNTGRTVGLGEKTGKDILAEIAKITPKPVKTAILLTGAFEGAVATLPEGVTVIAQENAKKDLEAATGDAVLPAAYLPTRTIDKDEKMTIDGVRMRLLHFAPAYTDGDLVVYFPDEKVVFTGNLLINDFPLAATVIDHLYLHGSVAGWITSVKGILALKSDTYVSGHGPIYTKQDVRTKLAFIQDKWDKIKVMVAQGKSLDEVKAAVDGPQGNLERTPSTTENIYSELTAK